MKETQAILLQMGFKNLNNNVWTSDIFGVFILHKDATPKQLAEFIYHRGQTSMRNQEIEIAPTIPVTEVTFITNVGQCSYQVQDVCNFRGQCNEATCSLKATPVIKY